MIFKNNNITYGAIAKSFHWVIAIIILCLLLVGLYMGTMENGPDKLQVYMLHKSFGLMVLWLAGLRILWRFYTSPPPPIDSQAKWEKILARITHIFLYFAMFGMPLSGWIMSSAGQYPVPFFGLEMPAIVGHNKELAGLAKEAHEVIAFILIAAIFLHAAGAFKHHILDGDMTLNRMIPNFLNIIWPLVLIIALILFSLGLVGTLFTKEDGADKSAQISKVEQQQSTAIQKKTYNPNEWIIVKEQSQINFSGEVYNTTFNANFSGFDGVITFDPNNLTASKADIVIDLKTVNSGDVERDANMMGAEWFNVADTPIAEFHSVEFLPDAEGKYSVIGDLTLVNKTMPVTIPFTLDIVETENERRAYVEGRFTLNRLDFGLGGEKWESSDSVGYDVPVTIRIVAENPENSAN